MEKMAAVARNSGVDPDIVCWSGSTKLEAEKLGGREAGRQGSWEAKKQGSSKVEAESGKTKGVASMIMGLTLKR
jgi:hypothetical protein